MATSEDEFLLEIFLNGCFSKAAGKIYLRLRETHNALQLSAFFFLLFFCQRYPNTGEFGAKNYITDQ